MPPVPRARRRGGPGRGGRAGSGPRTRCGRRPVPGGAGPPCRRTGRGRSGGDVRDEDEAVAGVGLHEVVDGLRDRRRGADEGLPVAGLDDQVADGPAVRLRPLTPLPGGRQRVAVHADLGPALGDVVVADVRVDLGQRAVRVVGRQVPVPDELQVLDGRGTADLLAAHLLGEVLGLGVGVAEHEGRGREDEQLVRPAAVLGEAGLDIGVEGLALGEVLYRLKMASALDAANSRPSSESPAWKITGRPCGERGTLNWPWMSKCWPWWTNAPALASLRKVPVAWSAMISSPCQESNSSWVVARNSLARE